MKNFIKRTAKTFLRKASYSLCMVPADFRVDDKWVKKVISRYMTTLLFFPRYPFDLFFSECADRLKPLLHDDEQRGYLCNTLIELFMNGAPCEKSIIHAMLTLCGLLDEDVTAMIMRDIIDSDDIGYRYWKSMDISFSTFYIGKGVYRDFYNDRRRVFKRIAAETALTIPPKARFREGVRICIVAYLLDKDLHNSSQRVCTMFANRLATHADEVLVLCLDSTYKSRRECREYPTLIRFPKSDRHKSGVIDHFKSDTIQVLFAQGESYVERAQSAIDTLYTFNPSIVIDIGDDYSPFSYIYARDYFTVYEPMRAGVSSQLFSRIIAVEGKYQAVNERFNNVLDEKQALYWLFPEYVPESLKDMTKADLDLDDCAFVILTIGNNKTLDEELIDSMRVLLESDSQCVWLLVGSAVSDYLRVSCGDLLSSGRIVQWGYENNLMGLCAACDVLLRQSVTGGSGSTAIAAMSGLPIVMTNGICDASRWLGMDYSDIETYDGLMEEIRRLKDDKQYYALQQKNVRKLVAAAMDSDEKWDELFRLLIEAEKQWRWSDNEWQHQKEHDIQRN